MVPWNRYISFIFMIFSLVIITFIHFSHLACYYYYRKSSHCHFKPFQSSHCPTLFDFSQRIWLVKSNHLFFLQFTVSTIDRRKNQLTFRINLIEMNKKPLLVDFRHCKVFFSLFHIQVSCSCVDVLFPMALSSFVKVILLLIHNGLYV